MSNLPAVTDATFEAEVLQSPLPTLVDFWAEWCGPCRMVTPVIESLAAKYGDKLKVLAVDVQDNVEVATQYGIMNIPAILVFNQGELVKRIQGYRPLGKLEQELADYL